MTHLINTLKSTFVEMFSDDSESLFENMQMQEINLSGEKIFFFLDYQAYKNEIFSLKGGDDSTLAQIRRPLLSKLIELKESLGITSEVLLVPIPLSPLRCVQRGFNQTKRILFEVSSADKERHVVFHPNNLVKTKETKRQSSLTQEERSHSQKGVFSLRHKDKIRGKVVFVFDDVATTGATLKEAKKVLMRSGAQEVYCTALAH